MARGQRNNGRKGSGGFEEDPPRDEGSDHGTSEEGPRTGHNSSARAKAIDETLAKFYDLQKQEDRLLEKHIDPIRKKKQKLKADLKTEYEIPTKAFNARAGLYIVERDDEDEIVLAVNEMFAATPVGKNIDLVALAERVAKKAAEKAAEKAKGKNTEAEA